MIESISSWSHFDLPSILAEFLQNAVRAQRQQDVRARNIWVQAANRLCSVESVSSGGLYRQLGLENRGALGEAIARARLDLDPTNALAHFELGLALQYANRHADSIAPYRAAFAIDPELQSLRNNLAAALLDEDPASREAAELLETALTRQADDANCWVNLAMVRLARHDLDGTLDAAKKAMTFAPGNAVVVSAYAQKLREGQRWSDAEAHARLTPNASWLYPLTSTPLVAATPPSEVPEPVPPAVERPPIAMALLPNAFAQYCALAPEMATESPALGALEHLPISVPFRAKAPVDVPAEINRAIVPSVLPERLPRPLVVSETATHVPADSFQTER
jgi:tetratricopeptide (TPR) repeat protein